MSRRWVALLGVPLLAGPLAGCANDAEPPQQAEPRLRAEIVQLRRDQVLNRIEVALENTGPQRVVVRRLRVRIPGYRSGGPVAKDSPVAPGTTVNLPWEYGRVRCGSAGAPDVGAAVVHLHLRVDGASEPTRLRLEAGDPDDLLQRIATRTCTVQRVTREVELRFGDEWRLDRDGGRDVLRGTLLARLRVDQPREVSQVSGAIMYGLRADVPAEPDGSGGPEGAGNHEVEVPDPLATLTPAQPTASIPVVAYAARCDGHTIGEIKTPYEFFVSVGPPGQEPVAVIPQVGEATKAALRKVCTF